MKDALRLCLCAGDCFVVEPPQLHVPRPAGMSEHSTKERVGADPALLERAVTQVPRDAVPLKPQQVDDRARTRVDVKALDIGSIAVEQRNAVHADTAQSAPETAVSDRDMRSVRRRDRQPPPACRGPMAEHAA